MLLASKINLQSATTIPDHDPIFIFVTLKQGKFLLPFFGFLYREISAMEIKTFYQTNFMSLSSNVN